MSNEVYEWSSECEEGYRIIPSDASIDDAKKWLNEILDWVLEKIDINDTIMIWEDNKVSIVKNYIIPLDIVISMFVTIKVNQIQWKKNSPKKI